MVEHSARAEDIVQGPQAGAAMSALREFMFERVYLGQAVRAEHAKIAAVLRRLFDHYVEHPELLPVDPSGPFDDDHDEEGAFGAASFQGDEGLARRVSDYLAGMTDRFCIRAYTELQVPQAFAR